MRDRIVVDSKEKKISEKLQLDPKLLLEKEVTKARQSEAVRAQQTFLLGNRSEQRSANVDHLSKGKGNDAKTKPKDPKKPSKPRLLKRLVEAGVSLNLDKCKFSKDKVKFLGHVIGFCGIEADPDKLQPIADLPPP